MRTVNIYLGASVAHQRPVGGGDHGVRLAVHVERVFPGVNAVIVPVAGTPAKLADDDEIARYLDHVLYGDGGLELSELFDADGAVRL